MSDKSKKPASKRPATKKVDAKSSTQKRATSASRNGGHSVKRRKAVAAKPKPGGNKRFNPLLRWLRNSMLWLIFIGMFLFLTYLGYLDYTVRESFTSRQWTLPAQVYASPLTINAGGSLSLQQVEEVLTQLSYRKVAHPDNPGSYVRHQSELIIHTRNFKFWDGLDPSRIVTVRFSKQKVRHIKLLSNGGFLSTLRLEPRVIGRFYPALEEDRVLVRMQDTPPLLVKALLATEDRDFYTHHGLSFKGIVRAMLANVRSGQIVQGGSTITQQLAKNLYLSGERSLWRKANEALIALLLEFHYDKDQILESYLNEIYLGQDGRRAVHGLGLGSQFYFGKNLSELQLHEIALLAGIIKGPSYYQPRRHPERATQRRNLVLELMEQQGFIDEEQSQQARLQALNVVPASRYSASSHPAFLSLVQRELDDDYDRQALTTAGLKIFTTLDLAVQNALEATISSGMKRLEKRKKVEKLQTAAVVTDRNTGEITGFAGGRNPGFPGFNRAMDAMRPIGSLVKPAVFFTALSRPDDYSLISLIKDQQVVLRNSQGKVWRPENYDHRVHGYVPLHEALTFSYNLATVNLGLDLGLGYVAKTLQQMGIKREIDLLPSLLLGALELSPLDVAQMYQTIADDGYFSRLRSIKAVTSESGELLQHFPLRMSQVLEPTPMYLLNTNLREVMEVGTGRSAAKLLPTQLAVAGKTGTTNGLRDSWFAGFSGDYVAVFWVGRDDNKPSYLTGSSGALDLWAHLMARIAKKSLDLVPTKAIEHVWIDTDNWRRATASCSGAIQYPFIQGSAPQQWSRCARRDSNSKSWLDLWLF